MKIFTVEDEEIIRIELTMLLEKYGYVCDSGEDFEHIINRIIDAEPNLILLDINLPFQDGYTVCREIQKI